MLENGNVIEILEEVGEKGLHVDQISKQMHDVNPLNAPIDPMVLCTSQIIIYQAQS